MEILFGFSWDFEWIFGWFLEGSKETMLSDFGHFGSFSQAGRLGHASQGAEVDDAGL